MVWFGASCAAALPPTIPNVATASETKARRPRRVFFVGEGSRSEPFACLPFMWAPSKWTTPSSSVLRRVARLGLGQRFQILDQVALLGSAQAEALQGVVVVD